MNSLHKLCLGSVFVLESETFQINLLRILRTPPSEGPARRPAGKHALKLKTFRDGWQVRQVPMTHLDIPQLIKDRRTGLLLYYHVYKTSWKMMWFEKFSMRIVSCWIFMRLNVHSWNLSQLWLHLPWSLSSRRFHFPVKKISTCTAPALGFGPWLFDCACIARERLRVPTIFNHVPKVSKSCHSASPKIMLVPLWSSAQNACKICKLQIRTLSPLGDGFVLPFFTTASSASSNSCRARTPISTCKGYGDHWRASLDKIHFDKKVLHFWEVMKSWNVSDVLVILNTPSSNCLQMNGNSSPLPFVTSRPPSHGDDDGDVRSLPCHISSYRTIETVDVNAFLV